MDVKSSENQKFMDGCMSETQLLEAQEKFDWLWETNKKARDHMKEAFGFYIGGEYQWDPSDKDILDAEDRPPISLNITKPKVNLLYGLERQMRTGWKALGVGGEDDALAMVITALLKYENRNNQLDHAFSRAFKDGNIGGIGWIDLSVVKGNDFLGSNRIRRESPFAVLRDTDGIEIDQSDWYCMGRQKWYSLSRIKSMFPNTAGNIKDVRDLLDYTLEEERWTEGTDRSERGGDYGMSDNMYESRFLDTMQQRARVVEVWTREYEKIFYLADNGGRETLLIGDNKKKAEEAMAKINDQMQMAGSDVRYGIQSKTEPQIYQEIFSGQLLLRKRQKSPYSHNRFPLVPYFAYLEDYDGRTEVYGMVKDLMDPQREKNKRRSMALDILNRSPKGGGLFSDRGKNAAVIQRFSETGGWHGVKDVKDFVEFKSTYLPVLNSVSSLELQAERDSEEISGINRSMMGFPQGSKESGVLARQRIMQGTMGTAELFEHLDMTKQVVLGMMISNIRQYWDVNKIVKAVGQLPGFEMDEEMAMAAQLLSGGDPLDYDIVLDDGESSPTARMANFTTMIEAVQYGIPIPPVALVEASPWANKQQILDALEEGQQTQMLQAMMQQQKGQAKK